MKTIELKSLAAVIEALRDKVNVTIRTTSGAKRNVFLNHDENGCPKAFIKMGDGFKPLRIREARFDKIGTFYANI